MVQSKENYWQPFSIQQTLSGLKVIKDKGFNVHSIEERVAHKAVITRKRVEERNNKLALEKDKRQERSGTWIPDYMDREMRT